MDRSAGRASAGTTLCRGRHETSAKMAELIEIGHTEVRILDFDGRIIDNASLEAEAAATG